MARSLSASIAAVALAVGHALVNGPWSAPGLSAQERARLLAANLTTDEIITLLHGTPSGKCQCNYSQDCAYVGNVAAIPRLGVPPITMNDGPQGFRDDQHPATSTAWPSGLTVAASWDRDAVYEWGAGMGKEFYGKGSNVQLGPGLCLARVPQNGRNFEYLSGEDPFLGYSLVQPAVRGIQSQKVVANAKHYILNNQETNRDAVSAEIDERTRFEMYYPPFEGAIEAGVGSFMCGYNKINGRWSCENPETLGHDLKEVLGFQGYVMSDWGATHSMSVMEGLDVEQPGARWMNEEFIKPALASGAVTREKLEDSARRIFWSMFSTGVMDEPVETWDWRRLRTNVTTDASVASARRLSALGTVLLKNEGGVLPLTPGKQSIAVLGLASSNTIVHAGGSGSVVPSFIATPLEGIQEAVGPNAKVSYNDGSDVQAASALAKAADVAIVFVATLSSEGSDRKGLSLDVGTEHTQQNALVEAVAKVCQKTIVVASVPGAVVLPWSKSVAAILTNFMPGQQAGNAIADIIFGKVNPSAKLPVTFPNDENETQFSPAQYPGITNPNRPDYVYYTEKLLVGYRFYDAHGIEFSTGFPFGHGLSYTEFGYSGLSVDQEFVDSFVASFDVKNNGKVAGSEVAQMYLSFPETSGEPPLQLKGFVKTRVLGAGESQRVTIQVRPRDLSVWDAGSHMWSLVHGQFGVSVGSSSRDIRLKTSVTIGEQFVV